MSYFSLPVSAAIPFVAPSELAGYFTLARKDGAALEPSCEAGTIGYTIRSAGGDGYTVEIDPADAGKIAACQ